MVTNSLAFFIRALWYRFASSLNRFPCENKLNYVSTQFSPRAEKNQCCLLLLIQKVEMNEIKNKTLTAPFGSEMNSVSTMIAL